MMRKGTKLFMTALITGALLLGSADDAVRSFGKGD